MWVRMGPILLLCRWRIASSGWRETTPTERGVRERRRRRMHCAPASIQHMRYQYALWKQDDLPSLPIPLLANLALLRAPTLAQVPTSTTRLASSRLRHQPTPHRPSSTPNLTPIPHKRNPTPPLTPPRPNPLRRSPKQLSHQPPPSTTFRATPQNHNAAIIHSFSHSAHPTRSIFPSPFKPVCVGLTT